MKRTVFALLLTAACSQAPDYSPELSSAAVMQGSADATLIQTKSGRARGLLAGNTREFLGIPYAQPPLGALRFAAPQPVAPWPEIRDTTHFGKSCMQSTLMVAEADMSEDCLTLNVFASASEPSAALPVMVFIHGGAFLAGGSSSYDAKALREAGNIVVVTLNYRLGAFGFLAHPALCPTAEPCTNQGLRDQQLALHWVKDNIAAFGGDPGNITLFGESAGSVSACAHMFAKGSEQLADHYILQSGACAHGPLAPQSEQLAQAAGQSVIDTLCPARTDPISCLRDAAPSDLAAILVDTVDPVVDGFWPWIDHALFDDPLEQLLERSAFIEGAVIAGTNQNEWLLWQALGGTTTPLGNISLRSTIEQYFPDTAKRVADHYVPENPLGAGDAFLRLMTDAYFRCPTRALARGLVAQQRDTFLYEFAVQPAAHALEVDYVFDLPAVSLLFPFEAPNPLQANVVRAMQSYWTQLAAAGDPNRPGFPEWPHYGAAQQHMIFQDPPRLGEDLAEADCDFWDSVWAR